MTTWLRLETNTVDRLRSLLTQNGVLLSNHQSMPWSHPSNSVAAQTYTITSSGMGTLHPLHYPEPIVINAFLSLLQSDGTKVLPSDFLYHLLKKSYNQMLSWPLSLNARCTRIFIPLMEHVSMHCAVAVVKISERCIEIIDHQPEKRVFVTV